MKSKKGSIVRYNRWGYFFLIPFAVVFIIFQLIPLCSTIYNSFFKHFFDGIMEIGPEPVACIGDDKEVCDRKASCITVRIYEKINDAVNDVVDHITLADMVAWQKEQ